MEVKLRIVIPTFNRAERLKGLLDAVVEASQHPNIEIVVVDDFSIKEEREKLKAIAGEVNSIRFIFLPENAGGGNARNVGAFTGDTKWVWFVDDDDLVTSETVIGVYNRLVSIERKNLYFLSVNYHVGGRVRSVKPDGENLFERFSRYGNNINTTCALFDFEFLKKLGGWDCDLVAGQDTDLLLRAAELTDACVLEGFSVDVIQHEGTRITTNPKKQMVGKIQFVRKNYSRLHVLRLSRYVLTTIFFYPYLRRLIGR